MTCNNILYVIFLHSYLSHMCGNLTTLWIILVNTRLFGGVYNRKEINDKDPKPHSSRLLRERGGQIVPEWVVPCDHRQMESSHSFPSSDWW